MKANQLCVRPSCMLKTEFSVFWVFEMNRAHELFGGTESECYQYKKKITNLLDMIWSRISKQFTKEVWEVLNAENEDGLFQISFGKLLFEFTTRDFCDNEGYEVNCECFILGEGTYGVTGNCNEKPGFPYDNEWCCNYYLKENKTYEETKEYIYEEISNFIVDSLEMVDKALEENLTWESIKNNIYIE